ncbi:Ku protein [Actinoplanes sp. NPDC051470]|uniref:non-homologous end joining protein Ku n=1 Tax=Actinoplanes sp. NPDC051470 TaxID=3157224 RepID=UPI0034456664
MARPIWTGAITFGLVSVPVGMYSATHEHEVSFHQYEKGTSDRIRYQRVNERTGKEVDYADIVKGTDTGGGKLVMLEQEELDSVAPGRSKSLDLHAFVDLEEIDPIFYQKSYYLAPGSDESAKTYALLRDAMAKVGRAAIGTLVMRGKEYLAAIRPDGKLLVLETMFFADEVREPEDELGGLPSATAKPAEMKMAVQLIESMSGKWKPKDYRDSYTDRVQKLIAEKKKGKEVTVAEPAPEATDVTDLMEALRASVDRAKTRRGAAAKSTPTKKKSTAAKKTTAKKTPTKKTTAKKKAA